MKVSCIVCTKDRPNFIYKCIELFLNQTYKNTEMVIVDDSKNPYNVPNSTSVKYVHLATSRSIGFKRNLGIENSTGDIILIWDDDDYYGPNRIKNQLRELTRTKGDAIVYNTCVYYHLPSQMMYTFSQEIHDTLWKGGYIAGTIMFKRNIFEKYGIKYPHKSFREDSMFIDRLLSGGFKVSTMTVPCGDFVYVKHNKSTLHISYENAIKRRFIRANDLYSGNFCNLFKN